MTRLPTRLAIAASLVAPASPAAAATVPAGFSDSLIASVPQPTALAFTPDGRLLVATQDGELRVYTQAGALLETAIVFGQGGAPPICSSSERGLLGIAVDPGFAANQLLYLYYTADVPGVGCKNRVSRFTLPETNLISPGSELTLIDGIHSTNGNHNGGDLHFGKDGLLYVSVGDGGCDYAGDSGCAGQNDAARDRHVLLGKILRIEPDGGIPPGNPFQGAGSSRCHLAGSTTPGETCQEAYALGLRNPFRIAMDPNAPGVRFFVNDVGQNAWEEIDQGAAGADYGWNCREGRHPNPGGVPAGCPDPSQLTDPVFEYGRDTGCSAITAGAFVPNGLWASAYDDSYLYGDYTCGRLFRLRPNGTGGWVSSSFATQTGGVVSMAFGPSGAGQALYYTTYLAGGQVRKIAYGGGRPVAAVTANPVAGPVPLDVGFDGSGSSDPDNDPLTWIWDFGDGSPAAETAKPIVQHSYAEAGNFTATLRVRDAIGLVSDPATVVIHPGNTPPVPSIAAPAPGTLFSVGQTLTLTGSASDVQDGPLPAAALAWQVLRRHGNHTHPWFGPATGNDLTFPAPAPEDLEATDDSYLEVYLAATDSEGHTGTAKRVVYPLAVSVTLDSVPQGLTLEVSGIGLATPATVLSWAGWGLSLSAPDQLDLQGHGRAFASWSDGGAQGHVVVTPASDATFSASFVAKPALIVDDVVAGEGAGAASFAVRLSDPSTAPVTAGYATADGTAAAGSDYAVSTGTVSFAPSQTLQTVEVPVQADAALEGTESFFLDLSGIAGDVLVARARGQAWLLDDDFGPRFRFDRAAYTAREGMASAVVRVIREGGASGGASVDYAAGDGSAIAPADFDAVQGTLSFGPGVADRTFAVPLVDDTRAEGPETIQLALRDASGAALGEPSVALLTLADDDRGGTLSLSSASLTVAEAGPLAVLTVRRSGGSASDVTVAYATSDGTAAAFGDYLEATGTLSFGPGEMQQTIAVPILEDFDPEGDETFQVVLDEAGGGASLGAPSAATVTIIENERAVRFSAAGYAARESAGSALVTVERSGPALNEAFVSYAASDGGAEQPDDYAATSGTLRFPPGVRTRTFSVPIVRDTLDEGDEGVMLSLSGPVAVGLGQPQTAVLAIRDDDAGGTLGFGAAAYKVKETLAQAVIAVRRTAGTAGAVTVDYATGGGTAVPGTNYDAVSGTLSFGPGVASRSFAVPIHDDGAPTSDLTVGLALSGATGGAGIGRGSAELTIQSAEPLVQFAAGRSVARERSGRALIAVRRSGPTQDPVTVEYATSDGTAEAPGDYVPASGTLSFGPGVVTRSFAVELVDDGAAESDETVGLSLSNPVGAGLGADASATLTIATGDPALRFSAETYGVTEVAPRATITVRRSPATGQAATVSYSTADGTAAAGSDYLAVSGTLSFAPGAVARTFGVPILNDADSEDVETVILTLSDPSASAVLGMPAQAELRIQRNDAAGTLQFATGVASVSESGPYAVVTVTRTGGTAGNVSVDYATADGTAQAWVDYVPASGTLVFGSGELSKAILVTILDDGLVDGNERLFLTLSNPQGGGVLGDLTTATLWIVENR